jgi:hypothetical protein
VRSSSVVAVLEVVVVVFVVDIQSSRRGICRGGSRRVRNRVERNCYRRELQPFDFCMVTEHVPQGDESSLSRSFRCSRVVVICGSCHGGSCRGTCRGGNRRVKRRVELLPGMRFNRNMEMKRFDIGLS